MAKKQKTEEDIAAFRARVVEAATRIFVEKGPEQVTMRAIASELGVSAMTPYLYFKDRDAIFLAVRLSALTRFADSLEAETEGLDPIAASRAVSSAYTRFALGDPMTYRLLFDFGVLRSDEAPELSEATQRARRTMTGYVERMIEHGIVVGDATTIGAMFWVAMHGSVMLELSSTLGDSIDPEALRRTLFQTILAGLRADAPLSH
ncbi:MAG: TetR/AcrR family transcriptional regulator [Sphingomonadales bacterium]